MGTLSRTKVRPQREKRLSHPYTWAQCAVFIFLLFLWWAVTHAQLVRPLFLPSPESVIEAFIRSNTCREIGDGSSEICGEQNYFLWQHLLASMERIALGVGVGLLVGVALGFLLGTVKPLRIIVEPYLHFLRSLPPLGYIGLLIVWFGIGDISKVWLLFLAAFPPIAVSTLSGVNNVRIDHVLAAQSLGASRIQVLRTVILPSALPAIFYGIRVATGFAWTTVVAAELNNGIPGIGGLAYISGTQLDTPLTIACILVIGIAAVILDYFLKKIAAVLIPWQGK